jgi:hypothetical protein
MIIQGCIKIHQKGCVWWIIVIGLRVLLIMYYLIREILVEMVLDIHIKGVKKKKSWSIYYNNASSTKKKGSWENTCVGLHIENHTFLTRPW